MNPFLNVKLTLESIELILKALRKLPHEQVHDLVVDLINQANNTPKKRGRRPRAKVAN